MLICTITDLFLAVTSKGGGFPGGSVGTESADNAGDPGSIPGLGKSLEKAMATQASILAWEIPWISVSWWATVHGVARIRHD